MNGAEHIDSDLLARYTAGEAGPEEIQAVERWAASAPEHARELSAMRAAWDLAVPDPHPASVDVDAAWSKLATRIAEEGSGAKVIPIARGRAVPWLRIAAAAALVTGVFLAVRWWSTPEAQQYASEGTSTSVVLDDSSHVVLSRGSRIRVAMGAERRVELEGQAYFEVTPDPQHPFVVEADGLSVTVLGTAFTVSAYDSSSTVLTRVRNGKVRVSADGRQVDLVAGEHAAFEERTQQLRKVEAPSIEIWGDRILMFSGTPLAEVVQQLSALYHVRIGLENDAMERCRLTATFENEPIDLVLRVVAETFGLRVSSPAAGEYLLSGDGC
ncbi:MAG: FecR domain-containing protein [Flavobacteriales bacterium]|nr:FecR domain-containing protein [Flavobacteriales bacterium]